VAASLATIHTNAIDLNVFQLWTNSPKMGGTLFIVSSLSPTLVRRKICAEFCYGSSEFQFQSSSCFICSMLSKNWRTLVTQNRNTKKNNKAGTRKNSHSRMVDDVLSLAGTLLSSKKDWVADKVSNLSSATHAYAEALNDVPGIGSYASSTAYTIDDFAEYLNDSDFNDLVRDGSVFAKRHTLQTLAGAVVAGIIATQIYRTGAKSR
jgi:hypothetical protein